MPYFKRILNLSPLLENRSVLLLGPRQCGKSTFIREQVVQSQEILASYNLLDQQVYLNLSQNLALIRQECQAQQKTRSKKGIIVIDEIQKIPELLDEVHLMIEEMGLRFLLTGSSARKLKRKGMNLLGGRARVRHLHPFVTSELEEEFQLEKAFSCGMMPFHYFSDLPDEDLRSYIGLYLKEEIAAEGISRNIPAFSRFLEVAALCSGEMIQYSSVASDAQVARQTVQNYFQVLEDTLIGFTLPPWTNTKKRKSIGTAKFYLFDLGVLRVLRGLDKVQERSTDFGIFFEHFIILELKAFLSYYFPDQQLFYWRSTSQFEVDCILGPLAIEIKSSSLISEKHLKGLRAFKEEKLCKRFIVVCFEKKKRVIDGFEIYPWKTFLEEIWNKSFHQDISK